MKRLTSYFTTLFVPILMVVAVASAASDVRAATPGSATPQAGADSKKIVPIDLNAADAKALADVPGVGDKLAADIIKARPFKTVEDLKKIKGIGDGKKFDTLKPYFMVATDKPAATPPKTSSSKSSSKLAPGEKININTATAEQLDKLPDIGATKSKAIIDYRTAHGPFKTIQDVMKVSGIKDATFAKIKDLIVVK